MKRTSTISARNRRQRSPAAGRVIFSAMVMAGNERFALPQSAQLAQHHFRWREPALRRRCPETGNSCEIDKTRTATRIAANFKRGVAQLGLERSVRDRKVGGSNPLAPTHIS